MHGLAFANITSLELNESLGGGQITIPNQTAGSTLALKLRLAEKIGGESFESRRVVHSIKSSLGMVDLRPEQGKYKLKIGDDVESAGVNTTDWIPYNATPLIFAEKVEALTGIASLVPLAGVEYWGGGYRVTFKDKSAPVTITCVDNTLWPVSFVTAEAVAFDEGFTHEIRLVQTPLAQSATFSEVVPAPPFITAIEDGGENEDITWNEIQKLTIPAEYRGAFQLQRGFRKTGPIGLPTSAEEIAEAMVLLADEDGEFGVTEEQNAVLFEFKGSMGGVDQDLLQVNVFDPPPPDLLVRLNTDTAEMRAAMRKADVRTGELRLLLEIVMELEREDEEDAYEKVIFRAEVVYVNPVSREEQSVTVDQEWNQPPARRRYVPYSPDQIIIGQKHYKDPFGDGVALSYTFNHNLGTSDLHITVRENLEGGRRLEDDEYQVEYDNDNSITLVFPAAPDENALVALITSVDQDAAFLAHNHPIGEVDGLQALLDSYGAAIAELQQRAGVSGLTVQSKTSTGTVAEWTLPKLVEVYPTREAIDASKVESLADLTGAMFKRTGGLLPAVHDAAVEELEVPLVTNPTVEGNVYENTEGVDVTLTAGYGVRSTQLQHGQFATALVEGTRVSWYRVAKVREGETSWYPTAFERQLFQIAVNSAQLRLKKTLTVLFGIELAILKSNIQATWTLVIEHGAISRDTTPEGAGITFTAATSGVITAAAHGFQNGAPVKVSSAGTLPAGLTAGTKYYVRDADTNTFKLALAPGGVAVTITSTGSGTHTIKGQPGSGQQKDITWDPVPILEQVIDLAPIPCAHLFGCRIERKMVGEVDSLVAISLLYGAEQEGQSKPASADFYLRARLVRFDTANSEPDPRGLVALMGLARVIGEGQASSDGAEVGKAIIK